MLLIFFANFNVGDFKHLITFFNVFNVKSENKKPPNGGCVVFLICKIKYTCVNFAAF